MTSGSPATGTVASVTGIAAVISILLALVSHVTPVAAQDGDPHPGVELHMAKTADADAVDLGGVASYTITVWNTGPDTAIDVLVEDTIPAGWTFDDAACDSAASSVEDGGRESWSCSIDELEMTTPATGVVIRISGPTMREHCGELTNTAVASASNSQEELVRSATIAVVCPAITLPTLAIEKEADADEIVISGSGDRVEVEPAIVTWTLTYTLADGPVTNAVISDALPEGLVYVDGSASHGAIHDEATNSLTWIFPTMSEGGSVSFQTQVDPQTISRVASTVNVALIGSDQTPEDAGASQISVVVEPPPLGGTPAPTPHAPRALPDTAMTTEPWRGPASVPPELLIAVLIGSLGALAAGRTESEEARRR